MHVKLDQGIYRHLIFREDGSNTWHHRFELVTTPNTLMITGDMGTWVFSRVQDMFTFFRGDMKINPSYWSEKLQNGVSGDYHRHGSMEYDPETFKDTVLFDLENYDLEPHQLVAVKEAIEEIDFSHEPPAREALESIDPGFDFEFSDLWEIDGRAYKYQFIWCLYAIVWGIQQYDAMKAEVAV